MATDLALGPDQALAALDALRRQLLKAGNARLFMIASTSTQKTLVPTMQQFVDRLDRAPATKAHYDGVQLVNARLRARDPQARHPVFVGLLHPSSQGGVFLHSAPMTSYADTGRDQLLDYLSANLYSGSGGHSLFMKTWDAGLAYSNGMSVNLFTGRLAYYAERTPDLPQTLRFVIEALKNAKPDPALVEYAVAQAFTSTRSANSYESRGEQMAHNLADGLTPALVTRFHREILTLRRADDLAGELYRRMPGVSAKVLPGMGLKSAEVHDGVYFVIGPEKQLAAWEESVQSIEGPETKVYRLYPRDFWM